MKWRAEKARALDAELLHWPGAKAEVERAGKHEKVHLFFADARRFVTRSTTSGDHRGIQNHLSDVRRALKQLGAERK